MEISIDLENTKRVVTVRQFSHRYAEILDEVEKTGEPLLVTRYGLPAVFVVAAKDVTWDRRRHLNEAREARRKQAKGQTLEEVDVPNVELSEFQIRMLLTIAEAWPNTAKEEPFCAYGEAKDVNRGLAKLEIAKLIMEGPRGSYKITALGLAAARARGFAAGAAHLAG